MKTCPACGNQYDKDGAFCPFCGTAAATAPKADPVHAAPNPPHVAPYPPPAPPAYYDSPVSHGKGGGWIMLVRVMLWIFFALFCLSSFVSALNYFSRDKIAIGFAVLIGGIFAAFLVIAMGMVTLDMAKNTQRIANNTAEIAKNLKNK